VVHPSSNMDLHPSLGGCYDTRAAPGSSVCREARDGACVRHAEETVRSVETTWTCTTSPEKCNPDACNVQIGSNVYCSQCKTGGNVPIDGVCVDKAAAVDKCLTANNQEITTEQVCGKCGDNHFLFKGGCYNVDTAPGNLICSAIDTANTAVCKTCAAGYFKNPAASDATHQSCIACSDTTGADSNTGVANCATCDPPETSGGAATCTACTDTITVEQTQSHVLLVIMHVPPVPVQGILVAPRVTTALHHTSRKETPVTEQAHVSLKAGVAIHTFQ
ncbi:Variant-specific surface protein, partial [Giardia duodenalis]